jgi:CRISPR-associated endonuclease/helicase Cas3
VPTGDSLSRSSGVEPARSRAVSPLGAHPAIAHRAEDGREHLLQEHLEAVGVLARRFASKWGADSYGEIAGLLHDLGKYAADFQGYIRAASRGPEERRDAHIELEPEKSGPQRGRVDHSSAGALKARELYGPLGELLAFVIAGHHAGLANHVDLRARMERKKQRLHDALAGAPPEALVAQRSLAAPFETRAVSAGESEEIARRFELWIRMLFSALCDADFLDTEKFFDPGKADVRDETKSTSLEGLLSRLTAFIDSKQTIPDTSEVNAVRRAVREAAMRAASSAPGVFTLTVPTGGGKTLAGMEFALRHACLNGLDRVVVAIPYTSILEQNADVYRTAFGDENAVLEHHANFDPERETARSRLASQNWDVPVVVTTTVQLFESLFARRTSRCRKLHNLARSVIVLDEAQTMPPRLLEPTLEALEGLVRHYGASLVICTATQPALGRASLGRFGFASMQEIVPPELRAFERLRRVEVLATL